MGQYQNLHEQEQTANEQEAVQEAAVTEKNKGFFQRHKKLRYLLLGLGFVALFLLIQVAFSAAASAVLAIRTLAESGMDPQAPVDPAFAADLMDRAGHMVGGSNLLTLLTLWLIFRCKGGNPRRALGLVNPEKRPLFQWLFWGIGLNLVITLLMGLLPASVLESYNSSAAIQAVSATDFFTVLSVVLLAPLCEELIFRQLAYGSFKQAMPQWAALLLQALLFALIHGHPLQMAYAFVLALVLGLVREKSGTVLGSILLHMGFNGANYILMLLVPGLTA